MNENELLSLKSELKTQNFLPHGLLNIAKTAGGSSRHVVTRLEHALRPLAVGHAGTLDPMATGVLVIGVGRGTKLVEYLHRFTKTYVATFLFGYRSDTEDVTGIVEPIPQSKQPTLAEIENALPQFRGNILQQPPAFSAIKVDGRRAYKLARKGRNVELQPRPIVVHRLEIQCYEYPKLQLEIECGSGTYIRSLGRDLARAVGTEAIMSALCRTSIGPFHLQDAHSPEEIGAETLTSLLQSSLLAIPALPRVELTAAQAEKLRVTGVLFDLPIPAADFAKDAELAALVPDGRLFAILTPSRGDRWKVKSLLG